jgi:hypothetical protein
MTKLLETIALHNIEIAPSQIWGSIRLVPLLRKDFREDLRLAKRGYNSRVMIPVERNTFYHSYVPHGLVLNWSDNGEPVASLGGQLSDKSHQFAGVKVLRRMAQREKRREDKNSLRFLPLEMAMEGFMGMFFKGPTIAWQEYSRRSRSTGLSPRTEYSLTGRSISDLSEALRVFEIHENQVGVLLFVGEMLATAFIVPHPQDYRDLHETLLTDAYGETFYYYGLYGQAQELKCSIASLAPEVIEDKNIHDLADLRSALTKMRQEWSEVQSMMSEDLLQRPIQSQQIYQAGAFSLQRFVTDLDRTRTNYIGESIVDDSGDLQYLKIYGLSAVQTRRAYLLQELDRHNWQLEKAAIALNETLPSLVKRIEKADLGYLINNQVREQSEKALRKY